LGSFIDVKTELSTGNEIYDKRIDPVFLIGFQDQVLLYSILF
jgi:hypothetical protein